MPEFSISDIVDGLDLWFMYLRIVLDDTPKYSAIFFLCDSLVALYEFFELFFAEGRMSAKRLSRQQGFIKNAYLTILQLPSFLDFFLSTITLSWSDATILETVLLDIPILPLTSDGDMLGLELFLNLSLYKSQILVWLLFCLLLINTFPTDRTI